MTNTRRSVPATERPHFDTLKTHAQALLSQLTQPGAPLQQLSSQQKSPA